jgi:lipoyl(octanoyl) transferase
MPEKAIPNRAAPAPLVLFSPGLSPYVEAYQAMQGFTAARSPTEPDRIWLLQHPPVYTLGQAAKPEHLLAPGAIPVQAIDRGGQVTYHGPGQLIVYVLLDVARRGWGVKTLVRQLEQAVIDYCAGLGIAAERRAGAPGVYAGGQKLAALGLRIRRGCCYHGLSLNVDMDLRPFSGINPCGYPGLQVTQLRDFGARLAPEQAAAGFLPVLLACLGYSEFQSASPENFWDYAG